MLFSCRCEGICVDVCDAEAEAEAEVGLSFVTFMMMSQWSV